MFDISPTLNEAASAIVDVSIYILSLSEWKYLEKVGNPKEDGAPSASGYRLGESLLLISVLCFHSLFEGIVLGVAESEGEAWRALWTVCLHKIFAAIAMGIAPLKMLP